jgi:hypothetical protein
MSGPVEIDRSRDTGQILNATLIDPTRTLFGR